MSTKRRRELTEEEATAHGLRGVDVHSSAATSAVNGADEGDDGFAALPSAAAASAADGSSGSSSARKKPRMRPTPGPCATCGKSLTFNTAGKHVAQCWGAGDKASVLAIKAHQYGKGSPFYWMIVAVPHGRTLLDVDKLLRREWLECCGHMSKFFGAPKSRKVQALFNGQCLDYEYDAGSSTLLDMKKVGTVHCDASVKQPTVVVHSVRPWVDCWKCKGPCQAVACPLCLVDFCVPCSKKHPCPSCGGHEWRPTGDSPRNGICGIDISAMAPVCPDSEDGGEYEAAYEEYVDAGI